MEILRSLSSPCLPSEIRVDNELLKKTFMYCKEVRNRYTILQMLWDLELLDSISDKLSAFESMPSEDFILINDPYNSDQGVLPTTVDVVLSGSEAQQLAEELTSIIENAKFLERDQSIHGFWDISVSLRQYGGSNMIYLCEDTVYVVKNDTRYIFGFEAASPEKKLYSEFYRNIKDMLAEQANKNNNN